MGTDLGCWRCGVPLTDLSLPLRRLEECPSCRAELHVCRMCRHYDPRVAKKCREDDAEEVKEKELANFCDYFRPRPDAFDSSLAAAERKARDQLDGLFGAGPKPVRSGAAPDSKPAGRVGDETGPDALFQTVKPRPQK